MGDYFIKGIEKFSVIKTASQITVRFGFLRRFNGMVKQCWLVTMIGLGEGRISDKLQPVSCVDKASDILWFEATHEMESFHHLVPKSLSLVYPKKGCALEQITEIFACGKGHFSPLWKWRKEEPLRLSSSSSIGFSQGLILRLWKLWHGPLWSRWLFLHLSRLRQ